MTAPTWPSVIGRLMRGEDVSAEESTWAMGRVFAGEATPAQLAGFLVALRAKGETAAEISGMADAMLAHALRVEVPGRAVDVVGTGGDQAQTVNISTMSAIVVAAAGAPVVKHGGRAASSQSGTADVLEALGVAIELSPAAVERCVAELGIGFCFAQAFHPAMRYAGGVRRELGVPTAMNVLGPLSNPAQPETGLIGCADPRLAPVMAEVFARRGESVLLVRGDDGLDELTTTTTSSVWITSGGAVRRETLDPAALGVRPVTAEELRGGPPEVNAAVVRDLVAGKGGPVRDTVLLNAAGALAAHRGVDGALAPAVADAMETVARAIDSGAAADLLARWAALSTELAAG
ncbi:anthranilate phosphoribosyltransferase [Pseudonocardia sp. EC080625-04]|uniref:anthranilate phosphoribosyltransferase n=1 Tax=Pseudonocardia sp. EC080625-04 TaxID=1096868 RepID=UPI0006CB2B36|nr:anthranilate phosphoribosyltransferase [Pseudonocardia sp. EC080625-04]ALE72941.1 anthranilate phosphoribosyltransferase [Pseudonocardia sp. EC080625-04]